MYKGHIATHSQKNHAPAALQYIRIEQSYAAYIVYSCPTLNNVVEPESGVTVLFNTVDSLNRAVTKTLIGGIYLLIHVLPDRFLLKLMNLKLI